MVLILYEFMNKVKNKTFPEKLLFSCKLNIKDTTDIDYEHSES